VADFARMMAAPKPFRQNANDFALRDQSVDAMMIERSAWAYPSRAAEQRRVFSTG
jgi:hypothetical protein